MGQASILRPPRVYEDPELYNFIHKYVVLNLPAERRFYVSKDGGNDNQDGKSWDTPFLTVQKAIDKLVGGKGEWIFVGPGEYDEAVTIKDKSMISIYGVGPEGSVFIKPSAANSTALTINGSKTALADTLTDIALINLGCEGKGTGGGLYVQNNVLRVRIQRGKYEGGAFGVKLEGPASGGGFNGGVGDIRIEEAELAWTEDALYLKGTGDFSISQVRLLNCLLHGFSSRGVRSDGQKLLDLWILGNYFDRQEDDSEPTNEYILADVASSTGLVANNHFPAAAASAKISLATGVRKAGNAYTDGWAA